MNLAQLVVSLTSDTTSFSSGMRRAGAETATFEAAVKRAQRQGLDPMMARLGTAAQGAQAWDAGMRNTAGSTGTFAGSASKAAVSANTFRSALTPLVASIAGIPGPLGNVASLLGSFAMGSGLVVAVLAGLGATAVAVKKIGDDSRSTVVELDALVKKNREMAGGGVAKEVAEAYGLYAKAQRELAQGPSPLAQAFMSPAGIERWKRAREVLIAEFETEVKPRLDKLFSEEGPFSPKHAATAGASAGAAFGKGFVAAAQSQADDPMAWMQGMAGGMVPTIDDSGLPPILRGGRDRFGPNQGGESPYAEFIRKQAEAAAESQAFVDEEKARTQQWEDAWTSAAHAAADEFMGFINKVIDGSVQAQDVLKLLLNTFLRLLLSSILGGIGGGGGGALTSGGGALGLRSAGGGASLRAGDTYQTTNVYHIQALDAKSVADLLMAQRHTIALANGRAMTESRSLARMNRGW